MPFVEAMMTSTRDDWETPPEIFNPLNEEFEFTLDPCATPRTAKCTKYFTPEQDGLRQSWAGEVVFMNPPYGRQIGRWVRKAWEESRRGALVVGLLPARTDTKWFHRYILEKAEIRFLKGRIYFRRDGGKVDRAPFPSMIVVWRPYFPKIASEITTNEFFNEHFDIVR